ncbi:MAG: alkaline phosphatase family protein [Phycisphaerae bacterium]
MARVCFVLVAGLDGEVLGRGSGLSVLGGFGHRGSYEPVFPAVTSTMQATLTTGVGVSGHGIVCNGVYTHGRAEMRPHLDLSNHAESRLKVSFWEQANSLVQAPRFWEGLGKKTAMLFWQNSMPSLASERAAADVVLTPKPVHTADGKTLTACWSAPGDLYGRLANELGPFPLHKYWSPMAGIESSEWIAKAAERVWRREKPELQLVYIPHLDYNLQRFGPSGEMIGKDVGEVDRVLGPLAERVRADGGIFVVAGDYGISEVGICAMPNLALREAGLLVTTVDGSGKVVVDYDASAAFGMCDHQVGHVYVRERREEVEAVLRGVNGVGRVLATKEEIASVGLDHARSGDVVLMAEPGAWFAHDWWKDDGEKPLWQFTVDIHNKPGFDPRELFFDPVRKCIQQDAAVVRGSHGVVGAREKWPVVLSDAALPGGEMRATDIAGWLKSLVA